MYLDLCLNILYMKHKNIQFMLELESTNRKVKLSKSNYDRQKIIGKDNFRCYIDKTKHRKRNIKKNTVFSYT